MAQGFTKNQPLDTDPTLGSNSDYVAPSQKAVKTYVDSRVSPAYSKTAVIWHDQSVVITGNAFTIAHNTAANYSTYGHQSAVAAQDGDETNNGFIIAAGTYTFKILYLQRTDGGKVDFYVDTTKIGTLDTYGVDADNVVGSIASVVLTDGYHKLRMLLNGKHASSSSYSFYGIKMWLEPATY